MTTEYSQTQNSDILPIIKKPNNRKNNRQPYDERDVSNMIHNLAVSVGFRDYARLLPMAASEVTKRLRGILEIEEEKFHQTIYDALHETALINLAEAFALRTGLVKVIANN